MLFLILVAIGCYQENQEPTGFIYSSFTGNGEDGMNLLASYDGYEWTEVDDYKSMYLQAEGLVRDPNLVMGGDGKYHLIHTTEWFDHRIGLSHSEDLINWSPTEYLYVWHDYNGLGTEESDGSNWIGDNLTEPAKRDSLVKNVWAPEMYYDDRTKEYVIFWATTIEHPSIFPKTWNPAIWENMNHRMYYTVTKDFKTYSPRKLFYAPKNNMVIDAYITRIDNDTYVMAIKEETLQQIHVVKSQKKLDSWVNMPRDFWGDIAETNPFAGPTEPGGEPRAEGATILKSGDKWVLYCDYWSTQQNGVFETTDFVNYTDISDRLILPRWIRHGTVLPVPKSEVDRILAYKTEGSGVQVDPIPQSMWRGGIDLYPPANCMGCPANQSEAVADE